MIYEPETQNMQLYATKISLLEFFYREYMHARKGKKKKKKNKRRKRKEIITMTEDYLSKDYFWLQICSAGKFNIN